MVRGRHAGVVRDFQSTPTVQQKPGTTGGADSVRTASCNREERYVWSPGQVWDVGGAVGEFTVKGDQIARKGMERKKGGGEGEREKQSLLDNAVHVLIQSHHANGIHS